MGKKTWDDMTEEERYKYTYQDCVSYKNKGYFTVEHIEWIAYNEPKPYKDYMIPEEWLKGLTERQREVVKLRFEDGLTMRRVAETLGIKFQTVAKHSKYALKKMKNNCIMADKKTQ